MYTDEFVNEFSPGSVRDAFESLDPSDWDRVTFYDGGEHGFTFRMDDVAAIRNFLWLNGGFKAVMPPQRDWSPRSARIEAVALLRP